MSADGCSSGSRTEAIGRSVGRSHALGQQSAADFLVGSQENETARADEGHPRDAAREQPADKKATLDETLLLLRTAEGHLS